MQFIALFFSLIFLGTNTQEPIYEYIRDSNNSLSLAKVKNKEFSQTSENNLGLENGTYWFKFDAIDRERSILEIRSSHVQNLKLYDSNGLEITRMSHTRYPAFFVVNRRISYPLYLKADFPLEAYFPIHISSEEEFAASDKLNLLSSGLFYGTSIALIMATFIFALIFRKKRFLYFSTFVLAISLSITAKDNILDLLGTPFILYRCLEAFGHLFIGLSVTGFIITVLKVHKRKPILSYILISLGVVSIFSWIGYVLTGNVLIFLSLDVFGVLSFIFLGGFIPRINNTSMRIAVFLFYVVDVVILSNASILHTLGINFIEATPPLIASIALLNFTFMAVHLLTSLRDIEIGGRENRVKIADYIAEIKELDAYKTLQDADDEYMESLIYQFNLGNIEIKVLSEISKGRSNGFITEKYDLTEERLQNITNSLFQKLGIDSTQELTSLAI